MRLPATIAADPASSSRPVEDFAKGIDGGVKGLRIGVVRHFWEKDLRVNAELSAALEQALEVLRKLGARTEDVTMRPLQTYSDVKIVMAETELFSLHLPELIARAGDFGQDFRARSLAACLFTSEDYVRASRERRAMIEEMQPLYRRFDLLVTANGSPAPRLDAHDPLAFWQRPNFTSPFNCTGGPALALLCGFSKDGLPLSLQIAGRPHEDALVLRVGHAYEMATGFFKREPDLKPGAAPAALDPKPWRPDTSQVEPAVRAFAENAAMRAGLRLAPEQMEELVAVAPWAIAMAKRLRRDHPPLGSRFPRSSIRRAEVRIRAFLLRNARRSLVAQRRPEHAAANQPRNRNSEPRCSYPRENGGLGSAVRIIATRGRMSGNLGYDRSVRQRCAAGAVLRALRARCCCWSPRMVRAVAFPAADRRAARRSRARWWW